MKRKMISICILLMITMAINITNVYATSGALQKNSIKTCPNGITYGYHSSNGTIHWHQAEAHPEMSSGWAAVGDALSSDPCPNNNESTNQSNNTSNENNTSSNNQTNTNTEENKKSNDTGILKLTLNKDTFYTVEEITEYSSITKKLDIKVETNDEKATYEIEGNIDELSKEKVNEIKIIVTAEDGTQKTYLLNITREIKESYVRIRTLKINGNSIYFDSDNNGEVSITNDEDKLEIEYVLSNTNANLIITKNGVEVENGSQIDIGKNNYLLTIIDEDDNEYSYNLVVERMTLLDTIVTYIIGIILLIGIGYLIYYFSVKKNKANK